MTALDQRRPPDTARPVRGRRVRALLVGAGLLGSVLSAAGGLVYAAFLREPAHDPAAFLEAGGPRGAQTVVVTAGSSTTAATLSGDYVGLLRERFGGGYAFVNAGVNGATSRSLLDRLDEVIACRPHAVTLLIGGNDVRDGIAPDEFRRNVDTILGRLRRETSARVAVLSLTPHGERLDSAANRAQRPYNAALRELAAVHGAAYLPLRETMAALLARRPGRPAAEPPAGFGPLLDAAVQRYVGRRSFDDIAAANGLVLLSDHIHLSDRGAAVVADLVGEWLAEQDGSGNDRQEEGRQP